MNLAVCDCGYKFTAGDAASPTAFEMTASPAASSATATGSGGVVFGGFIGGIVGAILGYLFRPAIPFVGQQLPFEAVITRGASLKGLDQLLVGVAQQSFNYLVLGTLICGTAGAFIGYLAKVKGGTPGPSLEIPNQSTTTYQPQAPVQTVAPSPPVRIQLGDSRETVVATLGAPQKVMDLGPKTLYVYPDLKITFVDGKVSDVE